MKRATQLGLVLAAVGCAFTARADALGDYKVILDRNPFGLRPPPPPPKIETPPPPETPTNYKLTGITALFKPARAMFVNQLPGKPTPEYVSLSEGQLQGSIEVLPGGIDVKAGTVKVKISGEERTMSFEKDGLKMAAAPQPIMTAPGVPVPVPGINPVPAAPGGTMAAPPNVPVPQFNRPTTVPAAQPAVQPTPIPAPAGALQLQGTPTRPVRTISVPTTQQNATSPPPAPNVDPAEQALRMEIQRKLDERKVQVGELPPLPPTDLTGR